MKVQWRSVAFTSARQFCSPKNDVTAFELEIAPIWPADIDKLPENSSAPHYPSASEPLLLKGSKGHKAALAAGWKGSSGPLRNEGRGGMSGACAVQCRDAGAICALNPKCLFGMAHSHTRTNTHTHHPCPLPQRQAGSLRARCSISACARRRRAAPTR